MKIVTYNIQFGLGKDGRFDLERIAGEVDGADIIALQEVERFWQRSGNADQPKLLGKFLPDYYWAYGPYFDVDASTCLPGGGVKNVRRQFGNMILSKTPILSTRLFPLPKSDLSHSHNMVVGVFEGVVELPHEGALRIYNAHLGARSRDDRVEQIKAIRDTIRRAPAEGGAWTSRHANDLWKEDAAPPPMPEDFVLLGDFNLEAKDPEYDYLAGRGDADPGRGPSETGLIDTWNQAGNDKYEGITFSAFPPSSDAKGMRIDYAFVDPTMKSRVLGAWIDETAQGSDHQPYWVELDYAPHD
jgi:endonuclease/exonuclease/phosphatase family metal-dependent hydrolase